MRSNAVWLQNENEVRSEVEVGQVEKLRWMKLCRLGLYSIGQEGQYLYPFTPGLYLLLSV